VHRDLSGRISWTSDVSGLNAGADAHRASNHPSWLSVDDVASSVVRFFSSEGSEADLTYSRTTVAGQSGFSPHHSLEVGEAHARGAEAGCDSAHLSDASLAVPAGALAKIHIERVYDFFDPSTRTLQVLPTPNHALHTRAEVAEKAQSAQTLSVPLAALDGWRRRFVADSFGSNPSTSFGSNPATSSTQDSARPSKQVEGDPKSNVEVVTRWGVLAGKVLNFRVLAMTTTINSFITRKQMEASKGLGLWTRVESRARRIVDGARELCRKVAADPDCMDGSWRADEAHDAVLSELLTPEYLDVLIVLAKAAHKLLAVQPVLAEATAPCRIFGDLHGQLRDVLLMFHAFGMPGDPGGPSFVFNGDFVDRGDHQLETIGLLLALKVAYPEQVWLVRGNHEDRPMNERYGFQDECLRHLGEEFGQKTYDLMEEAFDQLPIGCLVAKRVLVVHGGIGDGRWDLNHLRAVRRPIKPHDPSMQWVMNILWSDPIEDDADGDETAQATFGVHQSPRLSESKATLFGWDVTKTFCARNGLGLIVRSHQSKPEGLGFDIMHDDMLVRVFSARDYEGHTNDGAVLLIKEREAGPDERGPAPALVVRPQVLHSTQRAQDEGSSRGPSSRTASTGASSSRSTRGPQVMSAQDVPAAQQGTAKRRRSRQRAEAAKT
jgi:diadenosine tetraphosphatase ApaH/serine/threonine PP2A family protein phosphatase